MRSDDAVHSPETARFVLVAVHLENEDSNDVDEEAQVDLRSEKQHSARSWN